MPERRSAPPSSQSSIDQRPIVFIHIPKTAGTSFISLLRGIFGQEQVHRMTHVDHTARTEIRSLLSRENARPACIAAHITRESLAESEGLYRPFTFLRHPVERVLSLYRFLRRQPESEQQYLGLKPDFSFEDFINTRTASLFIQVNDGMTRVLAGEATAINPQHSAFWNTTPDSSLVKKAADFLESSDFGLTEDMDGSMRVIQSAWRLPFQPEIARENATHAGDLPDQDTLMQVVEKNRMDLALYHHATALFARRLSAPAHRDSPEPEPVARFRPTPDETYAWPDIFGTQGFHAEDQGGFGWIRAEGAGRIHFDLAPGRMRVRILCYAIRPTYAAERTVVRLNDERIGTTCKREQDGWFTLETDLIDLTRRANTLAIEPPYFIPVQFLDPESRDSRSLGLAVASVTFRADD